MVQHSDTMTMNLTYFSIFRFKFKTMFVKFYYTFVIIIHLKKIFANNYLIFLNFCLHLLSGLL